MVKSTRKTCWFSIKQLSIKQLSILGHNNQIIVMLYTYLFILFIYIYDIINNIYIYIYRAYDIMCVIDKYFTLQNDIKYNMFKRGLSVL